MVGFCVISKFLRRPDWLAGSSVHRAGSDGDGHRRRVESAGAGISAEDR